MNTISKHEHKDSIATPFILTIFIFGIFAIPFIPLLFLGIIPDMLVIGLSIAGIFFDLLFITMFSLWGLK